MKTKFSKIIQGCMTWGAWGKQLDSNQMVDLMHHCLSQGITTFDHADIYGDYTTEGDFGTAFAKANIDRSTIQLISKCGIQYTGKSRPENHVKHYEYTAKYIIWSAERSLQLLQTEYLDLLLLHRPSPLMQADEVQKAIEQLKAQGKILDFGVSNFTPSQSDLIATKLPILVNQIEFSLTQHSAMHDGSLDHMQTNGITPMSWSPLGSVFREDTAQTQRIKALLRTLTEKYNVTEDQLLLAWIMQHPAGVHPVIGTTSKDRITNAVKAASITLELQDWFALLIESQGHKVP
ncbi:aldo/keto reductase family oxidoreductase [Dokdonia ponticola]|uniref:Aldo/keto reductase family oxidoreductase n=1 Tax=Dokdonia ponticola TaxID=2041041 RepID=A0ABV9I540_9FLAO